MGRTVRVAALSTVLLAAALTGLPAAGAARAGSAALADFNGDGIDDLVVGVPTEDLGVDLDAGVVDVIYGSESACPTAAASSSPRPTPSPATPTGPP